MNHKICKHCDKKVVGRIDKEFCSIDCKNKYNYERRSQTKSATAVIDGYLHRNREILATLMGLSNKLIIDKSVLDQTGFKYDYHTSHYLNKDGKTYWMIYDFAWMTFSDQKILLIKKRF